MINLHFSFLSVNLTASPEIKADTLFGEHVKIVTLKVEKFQGLFIQVLPYMANHPYAQQKEPHWVYCISGSHTISCRVSCFRSLCELRLASDLKSHLF